MSPMANILILAALPEDPVRWTRTVAPDPRVLRENMRDADADTLRGYDRSAEATFSPHLWRGTLPTDLSVGAHRIEVRAFDAWRGEVRAQGEYRLHDAEP